MSNLSYSAAGHSDFAYIHGSLNQYFYASEYILPGGWDINCNDTSRIELYYTPTGTSLHWFYNNGNAAHAGNVTAGNFILNSDIIKKENIKPICVNSDIDKIKLVTYNMLDNPVKRYGVIAQDVELYEPELVYENNGTKTVAYIDFLILKVANLDEKYKKLYDEIQLLKQSINKK